MRRVFRGALDIALSTGPILKREFLGLLRTRKAYWITLFTVGAASLVPLLAWPDEGSPMPFEGAMYASIICGNALLIAFLFFTPAIAAGAITSERERGTYEGLYNTQILPSGIVLGKILSSTLFSLLLLALTFPMFSLLYLLGGFPVLYFGIAALIFVFLNLFLAILGLWSSMRSPTTARAIVQAYLIFFLINISISFLSGIGAFLFISLWATSPLMGAFFVRGIELILGLAITLWFLISLFRGARYPDLPTSRKRERRALKTGRLQKTSSGTWLTRRVLSSAARGIPDSWNPVLVSTLRGESFLTRRSQGKLLVGMAVVLILVSLIYLASSSGRHFSLRVLKTIFFVLTLGLALILPGVAAAFLTGEREKGRFDLLRTTILGPSEILRGKLLALLVGGSNLPVLGAIFFVILLPFLLMAGELGRGMDLLLYFLMTSLSLILVIGPLGFLASTLQRGAVGAQALSYLMALGLLVLLPVLGGMTSLSPLTMAPQILERKELGLEHSIAPLLSAFLAGFILLQISIILFRKRWMRD